MRRDEHVLGDDVLAAGAGQTHGPPVVVDDAVRGRYQDEAGLRTGAVRQHGAEMQPLRIVAAAAEPPGSGNAVAAVDRSALTGGRIGAGRQSVAVGPVFVLRLA